MYSFKKALRGIIKLPVALLCILIIKFPFCNKYKMRLLSTWHDFEKRNKIENIFFPVFHATWNRFEYLKEKDPDKRETMKSICMGGECGKKWAEGYQKKFSTGDDAGIDFNAKVGSMTLLEVTPMYDEISTILRETDTNYLVIQIGSSSGKETAFFAKQFPQHVFIGTDIYEEVVEYSSQFHNYSNLSFVKCSAKEIENLKKYKDSRFSQVLIFSSGSLQYVQPEHMTIFFNSLGQFGEFKILISEPANEYKGKPNEIKKSIYRGNFSYTHDYKWYAEKSGFETVKCEIIRPYYPYVDFPAHKNTVQYFYYGKAKENQ
jgi:hypothetical protein